MQEMHERAPVPPVVVQRIARRRPPRVQNSQEAPPEAPPSSDSRLLAHHQRAVTLQVQEGIRVLQQTAGQLLRQLARGAPKTAQAPPAPVSDRDSIRALMSHVDERHQHLSLQLKRLEGVLRKLVDANREAVRATDGGAARTLIERVERLTGSAARLAAASHEAAGRHREDLQKANEEGRQALSALAQGLGERVAASVSETLGSGLAAIREEIAGVTRILADAASRAAPAPAPAPAEPQAPPGGRPRPPTPRFREIEDRLARVTVELEGLDDLGEDPMERIWGTGT